MKLSLGGGDPYSSNRWAGEPVGRASLGLATLGSKVRAGDCQDRSASTNFVMAWTNVPTLTGLRVQSSGVVVTL
jgi:hypothetical protein